MSARSHTRAKRNAKRRTKLRYLLANKKAEAARRAAEEKVIYWQ